MDKETGIVRDTYSHLGSVYDDWAETVREDERQKYLTKISQRFHNGAKILDIGCGNGLLNTLYMANHFDVIGIDISERQIAEAKRNVPSVEFICTDIRDFIVDPDSLDGIVSFYCFNHIPRATYGALFAKFHRWLKINGLFIASFGIGDTEYWTGEWLGVTTFFSSYNEEETISLIERKGFGIEERTVETALENEIEISFLWIIARKTKL